MKKFASDGMTLVCGAPERTVIAIVLRTRAARSGSARKAFRNAGSSRSDAVQQAVAVGLLGG